jgi:glycosyltransferase involved in cell wall biosynthesis
MPSEHQGRRPLRLVQITTVPVTLNFLQGHISWLSGRGFEVILISSSDATSALSTIAASHGVASREVPMQRRLSPGADIVSLVRLWRALRHLRPDVVHSHSPKAGLLGTLAARLAGVPLVFLSIFGLPQMTRSGAARRLLDATTWLACHFADRIWCDSDSMRRYVASHRLCPEPKLFVIGQGSVGGIDTQRIFAPELHVVDRREVRREFGIAEDACVLGFVGRLVRDKGITELCAAWRVLRERREDLELLLVGPFESEDPIAAEDEKFLRQDPRVHLAGAQGSVARFYAAMDVFVSPSYREGFGMTNLEASAMGLPVVSTNIPGCVDSVQDGVTGTLVPPRDTELLTEAILRYCEDRELSSAHGAAGRRRAVQEFAPIAYWRGLEGQYRQSHRQPWRKRDHPRPAQGRR